MAEIGQATLPDNATVASREAKAAIDYADTLDMADDPAAFGVAALAQAKASLAVAAELAETRRVGLTTFDGNVV